MLYHRRVKERKQKPNFVVYMKITKRTNFYSILLYVTKFITSVHKLARL